MRIASSNIQLESDQINYFSKSVYERLHKWDKRSDITLESFSENDTISKESTIKKDIVDFSKNALNADSGKKTSSLPSVTGDDNKDVFDGEIEELKMRIIKDMVEMLTGKKMTVFNAAEFARKQSDIQVVNAPPQSQAASAAAPAVQSQGWGIDYFRHEIQQSIEGFTFAAQGTVTNDKGVEINFNASLEMSRVQYSEEKLSIKDGDALIDPLVIDFEGKGVYLSDVKIEFDLDNDGTAEQISAPSGGTGLLSYDRNGNGIIDNGSELFGPSSGNGFLELAAFDNDKNGWIDENDDVFSKLKVWETASDGTGSLSSLLDKDVGAIYTGSAVTKYSLVNNNAMSGQIRESGIWMKESGGTGIIQEIDMVA